MHVIRWLSEQSVPLIMIDYRGKVICAFNDNGSAVDFILRQAQIEARQNGLGLKIAIKLIKEKIIACKDTLKIFTSQKREGTICKLNAHLKQLQYPLKSIRELLLIEARAAADYFSIWYTKPMNWQGTERNPIPEEWKYIGKRESFLSGKNRHSTDPVNAMLNYAYAVIESQVLISTTAIGLDPTVGFLHSSHPPGRKALIYDLMEPLRPKVEKVILDFISSTIYSPKDFILTRKGECLLHPSLARQIVELSMSSIPHDFMIKTNLLSTQFVRQE